MIHQLKLYIRIRIIVLIICVLGPCNVSSNCSELDDLRVVGIPSFVVSHTPLVRRQCVAPDEHRMELK